MRLLRNTRGFTLVEVLAVVVILAIVTMLSISLITSATKQQIAQSTHNRDIKELSYALKLITKDFRKSNKFTEIVDETSEPPITWYVLQLDDVELAAYALENNQIIRRLPTGREAIALNIKDFDISGSYSIVIVSQDGQTATADITLRSGTK
ncbi:PulJ/GspJ family protein [Lysinibacillus piscis]|uniref:Prepilin-type N-terminal cleavage/methylation domain-containing protein n=1 Tax=Lysinibacillus piscis TaxID=2518931 RepID=A0ABQ5NFV6_9BACI|nr:prepilin-type N-terminal cleavage/methylation domain-containing protein [Lysinibacillus sp. KH24]GLC87268.1 hypothetical protein LYSBPC_03950 [Lysinibacillus sp. KH24]